MKTLKPIYDFDSYSIPIAKLIYFKLVEEIFAPLQSIVSSQELYNAKASALVEALRKGKLQYVDGFFYGPLSAVVSKELRGIGATFNHLKKAYKLERSRLPQDILLAASQADQIAKAKLRKVEDFLSAMEGRKIQVPTIDKAFGEVLTGLSRQFQSTTKSVSGRDIAIELDPKLADQLKEAYTTNLEMYINDWYDTEILRLRQKVHKNVSQGFRAEKLIETIQDEKGISYNKAKFLAKQETSLMVSKYRQIRYEEVGVRKYMWSTSRDSRVRHDHRELQGKIFDFNQPPVTDRHTMARNNPGEDYGCRCVAIPVLSTHNMLELEHANK